MKVGEPAADLAIALAIAGAHHDRKLGRTTCAVGEIGLGGEVRHVQQMDQRLGEAARLGFTHAVCPPGVQRSPAGVELIVVKTLQEVLELLEQ